MISGMLANRVFADISKHDDQLQAAQPYAESRDYVLNIDGASLTYEPRRNVFTGTYPSSANTEFEDVITNFFTKLSSSQEALGTEFEQVLFDNLWDLYQS
jgi:hypothetical protein